MSPRRTWVDGRVDALLAALSALGMSTSRAAAAELIHERVQWIASQARISPSAARGYLTDDALTSLAQTMAFSFAEETPGADILEAPRTAAVPLPILGRCIAGLAEAIQVRLHERDDVEHIRTTITQLAHALSAVGQIIAEQTTPNDNRADATTNPAVVLLPPGLVHRTARYLAATATLLTQTKHPSDHSPDHQHLADTFLKDATILRQYAST
jgi:hypothetical protein